MDVHAGKPGIAQVTMSWVPLRVVLTLGMAAFIVTGCTQEIAAPVGVEDLRLDAAIVPMQGHTVGPHGTIRPGLDRIRPEEAAFLSLEDDIPGFAGYWFDSESGDLIAMVKDLLPGRSEVARARMESVLEARRNGLARKGGQVRARAAQYTFGELAVWRDALTDNLLGRGLGVRSTDADEVRNRVVVGVAGPAGRATVRRTAAALGIPAGAVLVVQEDAAEPESVAGSVGAPAMINGEVYSGMPVQRTGGGYCTVGIFAQQSATLLGVSNSHCSEDRHSGPDGSQFTTGSGTLIGYEVADRGFHDWCPDLWGVWQFCRYADAMLFSTVGGANAVMNRIVRYSVTNPGDSDDPIYLAYDASNPHIINARTSSRAGETVYKAGARTGRTQGQITATCKDVEYAILPIGPVMGCQHEATYGRDGGDSGAPVFVWPYAPANVDLRGIHWGHYPQLTGFKTVFSPLSGIERDFGALEGIPTGPAGGGGSGGGGGCTDPVTGEPIPC